MRAGLPRLRCGVPHDGFDIDRVVSRQSLVGTRPLIGTASCDRGHRVTSDLETHMEERAPVTSNEEKPNKSIDAPAGIDCVVIGAGPAGLTAAIYLRRFRRDVRVVDAGDSRALAIRRSRNVPGFAGGIGGAALLNQMRAQLHEFGGEVQQGTVQRLELRTGGMFAVWVDDAVLLSRAVILSTGVKDRWPDLPGAEAVLNAGLLRQCPVCDGYEHSGQSIGVLGNSPHGVREANFLCHFSKNIWFIEIEGCPGASDFAPALREARLRRMPGFARHLAMTPDGKVFVSTDDGSGRRFDVLYAALGTDPCSRLAKSLGARIDGLGNVVTNAQGLTSVPNLYAAGDVVSALDQIAVAVGHGAIAATAVHNVL